jgi:hypothetical protein
MRTLYGCSVLAALVLASGCSIKQTVTPAVMSSEMPPEICLIPAEGLRAGFNTTYDALLKKKGFQTRQIPSGSSPSSCRLSTTYIGTWSWDLALYMSYADIRVFEDGKQVGRAEYDSRHGGGRFDKFIDAEEKITEMTDLLFPAGAASLRGAQAF